MKNEIKVQPVPKNLIVPKKNQTHENQITVKTAVYQTISCNLWLLSRLITKSMIIKNGKGLSRRVEVGKIKKFNIDINIIPPKKLSTEK